MEPMGPEGIVFIEPWMTAANQWESGNKPVALIPYACIRLLSILHRRGMQMTVLYRTYPPHPCASWHNAAILVQHWMGQEKRWECGI